MSGDRLKETLGLYKFIMGMLLATLIPIFSSVLNKLEIENLDTYFYIGSLAIVMLSVGLLFMLVKSVLMVKEL